MRTTTSGSRLHRFARNRSGAIGLWLAVAILPVTLLAGAATDLRRVETVRGAMQEASDAAVLAAAKAYLAAGINDPRRLRKAEAAAGAAMTGALDSLGRRVDDLEWTVRTPADSGELVFASRARAPLAFGGLFGLTHLPVKASAASIVDIRLEVALVLDTTGSMLANNKLAIMKASSRSLIEQLEAAAGQSSRSDPLKLALVPYSNTVRVSPSFAGAAWLDRFASGPGYWSAARPSPNPPVDRLAGGGWAGCVESRPAPFDVQDAPAERSKPNSLFVPYWAGSASPNAGCEIGTVVPLTADAGAIKAGVAGLVAQGYTNIPMGLVWGWHALTPDTGPFGAGAAEPYKADLVKAVVLLTDGQNDLGDAGSNGYTGVGHMDQERVGVGVADGDLERRAALDGRLGKLCAAMKARGIVIYAIRVEVAQGSDAVMKACATKPAAPFYHDVRRAQDLPFVFARVGQDLIDVRLAR